ncbi:MAG: SRPBCC domain-containing protein [Micropepsaceae bacterium]
MFSRPEDSPLRVRRSILIAAPANRVWEEFQSIDKMRHWWGAHTGSPEAGTSKGQWLDEYDAHVGGAIRMSVMWDGVRVSYGGVLTRFDSARELSFQNDWIPNRGWKSPTFVTLRLTAALGGTLVELFHYGFELTGGDVAAEHAGYEQGWGMTQLNALKVLAEKT